MSLKAASCALCFKGNSVAKDYELHRCEEKISDSSVAGQWFLQHFLASTHTLNSARVATGQEMVREKYS